MRNPIPLAAAVFLVPAIAGAQLSSPASTSYTVNLGYVNATGNSQLTTANADEKIVRTDARWKYSEAAAYVYGKTAHVISANQLHGGLRADYQIASTFAGFAGAAYDRNTFAGYRRRYDEILGGLWRAVRAPQDSLGLELGGELTQQTNVDSTYKHSPAARGAVNFKHVFSKTAYFQELGEYVPDLEKGGHYRVNSESAVVAPISAHIGVKLVYAIHYDNQPPVSFGTTDRILTTGIQISW